MKSIPNPFWMALLLAAGCDRDMMDQPRYEAEEPSAFFADGRSARPLVPGTVPRGWLNEDERVHQGRAEGRPVAEVPVPVTAATLRRGRERFDIYCAVCHDRTGYGDGVPIRRGFPRPPSLHQERLRKAPAGHFFDVVTRGFGAMYPYADRVPVADRWAIVAYVRALQRSQNATLADAEPEARRKLEARR